MAEIIKEPTVSVHGIPKSQYEAQGGAVVDQGGGDTSSDVEQGGQQYGGIAGHFRRHWVMYSLGLAAAGVFIAYLAYRRSQAANSYAVTTGNSSTGQVGTPQTIDSSWGSQLDADYQQLTSVETTNTGLLQSILNGITGGTTGTGGTPVGTVPKASAVSPLMGNQGIYNPKIGQLFDWEGIIYELEPGAQNTGRVWGVQMNPNQKPYTTAQIRNLPVGIGPGKKRLLTNIG